MIYLNHVIWCGWMPRNPPNPRNKAIWRVGCLEDGAIGKKFRKFFLTQAKVSECVDVHIIIANSVGNGDLSGIAERVKGLVDEKCSFILFGRHVFAVFGGLIAYHNHTFALFGATLPTEFVREDDARLLEHHLPFTEAVSETLGWAGELTSGEKIPKYQKKDPVELLWTLLAVAVGFLPSIFEAGVLENIGDVIGSVLGTSGSLSPDDGRAVQQLFEIADKIGNIESLNAVNICEASLRWSLQHFDADFQLKKNVGSATAADPKGACNRLMLLAATEGFESRILQCRVGGFPETRKMRGGLQESFLSAEARVTVCVCSISTHRGNSSRTHRPDLIYYSWCYDPPP